MGVSLLSEPDYLNIAEKLRAIYTFGQPMLGDQALAKECSNLTNGSGRRLGENLIRYIYQRDVVPHLPPRQVGPYAPFGKEYQYEQQLSVPDEVISVITGGALEKGVSVPGVIGNAFRNPGSALKNLPTLPVKVLRDVVNVGVGATEWGANAVSKALSTNPVTTSTRIRNRWSGGQGSWRQRKGAQRAKQVQDLADLFIVAPLAFVANRLAITRTIPFGYSFEDHGPNHYVSALTPKTTRSEFGDVR